MLALAGLGAALAVAQQTRNPGPAAPAVRVVTDRSTGLVWELRRDAAHPGGPGRMTMSTANGTASNSRPETGWVRPVIRAGDRVMVVELAEAASAHLEGVAVSPAGAGAPLLIRFGFAARPVRAVAIGPGRARLAPAVPVEAER